MKIKKIIAVTSALCIMSGVFFGCGNSDSDKEYGLDPKKPVALKICHYYNGVQQENFDSAVIE
ncbi:MAG: ABC transporter substrate-binding protein, partial [Ruminococcus sp.]|nr:ABC transporter substrate-binding protein [Ruminococcus sp.]